jgi:hypothetical protein
MLILFAIVSISLNAQPLNKLDGVDGVFAEFVHGRTRDADDARFLGWIFADYQVAEEPDFIRSFLAGDEHEAPYEEEDEDYRRASRVVQVVITHCEMLNKDDDYGLVEFYRKCSKWDSIAACLLPEKRYASTPDHIEVLFSGVGST